MTTETSNSAESTEGARPDPRRLTLRWRHHAPIRQRLATALVDAAARIDRDRKRLHDFHLAAHAELLLGQACQAERQGLSYLAWDRLQSLDRLLVAVLTLEERRLKTKFVEAELEQKVHRWRSKAAETLLNEANGQMSAIAVPAMRPNSQPGEQHGAGADLGETSKGNQQGGVPTDHGGYSTSDVVKPEDEPSVARLRSLMELLHQQSQNQYHKSDLVRGRVWLLVGGMLVVLPALVGTLWWKQCSLGLDIKYVVLGALLGMFGALLSMAFGIMAPRAEADKLIPELRSSLAVSIMRPLIGAGAAVASMLLTHLGVLSIEGNTEQKTLFFCFLAGFSERWFLDQVERVGQDQDRKSE